MSEDYLLQLFSVRGGSGNREQRFSAKKLDSSDPGFAVSSGLLNVFSYGGLRLKPYTKTLIRFFVVVKMSGDVTDFAKLHNVTGPYDLRKERGKPILSIDLIVPREAIEGRTFEQYRDWVLTGLQQCFETLIASATERGELLNEAGLRAEIQIGFDKLTNTPKGDILWSPEGRHSWKKPEPDR